MFFLFNDVKQALKGTIERSDLLELIILPL